MKGGKGVKKGEWRAGENRRKKWKRRGREKKKMVVFHRLRRKRVISAMTATWARKSCVGGLEKRKRREEDWNEGGREEE